MALVIGAGDSTGGAIARRFAEEGFIAPPAKAATLELKVNMLRALNDQVPLVRAEGKLIHVGRQVAVAKGRIVGPDGKIYAHATTTCLIFDQPTLTTRSSHEQA